MNRTIPKRCLSHVERKRDGFDSYHGPGIADGYDGYDRSRMGEAAASTKTTDGGKNFKKLTTDCHEQIRRVGLDYFRKTPASSLHLDCEKIGHGPRPQGWAQAAAQWLQGETSAKTARAHRSRFLFLVGRRRGGLMVGDIVLADKTENMKTYDDLSKICAPTANAATRSRSASDATTEERRRTSASANARLRKGGGSDRAAKPGRPLPRYYGGQKRISRTSKGPAASEYGAYKSSDGGESWRRVNSLNPDAPVYFSVSAVVPRTPSTCTSSARAYPRTAANFQGRRRQARPADDTPWDQPRATAAYAVGTDGGPMSATTAPTTGTHLNHMAMGQFYHVADLHQASVWVYGGFKLTAPGRSEHRLKARRSDNEDWLSISARRLPVGHRSDDPDLVYYEMQERRHGAGPSQKPASKPRSGPRDRGRAARARHGQGEGCPAARFN